MTIPQTSVSQYQGAAIAGMLCGTGPRRTRTVIDDRSPVAQVSTGTMTNAEAGTYTATINGVPITVTYATSISATRQALVDAINASSFINDKVVATSGALGVYVVTSRTAGVGFTHTVSKTGATNAHSVAATTANVAAEYLTPGRLVVFNTMTSDDSIIRARVPSTTGQRVAGIVMHDQIGHDWLETDSGLVYPPKTPVEVLVQGEIWVPTEVAVTPADVPSFRHTAGTYPTPGVISTGTDSSSCDALTGVAAFLSAAGSSELVKLSVNFL